MFRKLISNVKNKVNISSLFNYDSNPSTKTSSTIEDFIDFTEEFIDNDYKEKKELLKKFIMDSISIIFESRKDKINNDFSLSTSKNSDFSNNTFGFPLSALHRNKTSEEHKFNFNFKKRNDIKKFILLNRNRNLNKMNNTKN